MADRTVPAVPNRMRLTLTTPAFPSRYADPLSSSPTFQACLDGAIRKGPGLAWPVALTLIALDVDGTRPTAHWRADEVHFSASLMKVAPMYTAYELRKVVRAVADEIKGETTKTTFLSDVAAHLNPKIMARAAKMRALKGIQEAHAVPRYASTFEVQGTHRPGFTVDFTSAFNEHLMKMIRDSDNTSASKVIHASGYGYLNGSLAEAGFFDDASNNGVWVAGDYVGGYPYFRIPTINDRGAAQVTSTSRLARLFALIHDNAVVDEKSCGQMRGLLRSTVTRKNANGQPEPETFLDRATAMAPGSPYSIVYNKLGVAPLKSGRDVLSEGSILEHSTSLRRFVVVWQNLTLGADGFESLGNVVRSALDDFLGPARTP